MGVVSYHFPLAVARTALLKRPRASLEGAFGSQNGPEALSGQGRGREGKKVAVAEEHGVCARRKRPAVVCSCGEMSVRESCTESPYYSEMDAAEATKHSSLCLFE